MDRTRTAVAVATVTIAVLTGCSPQPAAPPAATAARTAVELSIDAAEWLTDTVATCQDDAAAEFPNAGDEPALGLSREGCQMPTCETLGNYTDDAKLRARDETQGAEAAEFLERRWFAAGCRDVKAAAEAS